MTFKVYEIETLIFIYVICSLLNVTSRIYRYRHR